MKTRKKIIDLIMLTVLVLFGIVCFSYVNGKQSNFKAKKEESSNKSNLALSVKKYSQNDMKSVTATIDNNVVGLWKSEEDENWKLKFTANGLFIENYVGRPSDTSNYVISNTSPQCGVTVPVDQYTAYIKLTSPAKTQCYLLNGTTDSTLSLSPLENNKLWIFKKIQN